MQAISFLSKKNYCFQKNTIAWPLSIFYFSFFIKMNDLPSYIYDDLWCTFLKSYYPGQCLWRLFSFTIWTRSAPLMSIPMSNMIQYSATDVYAFSCPIRSKPVPLMFVIMSNMIQNSTTDVHSHVQYDEYNGGGQRRCRQWQRKTRQCRRKWRQRRQRRHRWPVPLTSNKWSNFSQSMEPCAAAVMHMLLL